MWLSDLISGGQVNNAGSQVQQSQTPSGNLHAPWTNHQTAALTPGQTLQGEIVARNGSEVQIKLADDTMVNARVDQNVNLEVGKSMTFEVRGNGRSLTLSPLFANTATDANVLKALDMASIPINDKSISMTELMMKAGLAVNRSSLQQMFREVNAFPGAQLSDIVDLHKLGLNVNEGNLEQIGSYKNLTHQLVEGMHTVLDAIPDDLQRMVQEGNVEGAAKMFQGLLEMVQELQTENEGFAPENNVLQEQAEQTGEEGLSAVSENKKGAEDAGSVPNAQQFLEGVKQEAVLAFADANTEALLAVTDKKAANVTDAAALETALKEGEEGQTEVREKPEMTRLMGTEMEIRTDQAPITKEFVQLIGAESGQPQGYGELLQQLAAAEQNGDLAQQAKALQQILQRGEQEHNPALLEKMMTKGGAQKLLQEGLSKLWTIEPREVADAGKVDELYQRLNRQLKSLTTILEQGGQTQGSAYKAAANMTQNLDFLQQLNQAYTYVQLPLRLQQGEAHGDLYVYTNKRNLAAKDGQISALLHLDMEHLGPVDVYVAMQAEKVNTRFYVKNDEMLDFLEQHMDLLTKRLEKRGYHCSFEMQIRQKNAEPKSGLKGIMGSSQTDSGLPIAQYAFDVRA